MWHDVSSTCNFMCFHHKSKGNNKNFLTQHSCYCLGQGQPSFDGQDEGSSSNARLYGCNAHLSAPLVLVQKFEMLQCCANEHSMLVPCRSSTSIQEWHCTCLLLPDRASLPFSIPPFLSSFLDQS